MKKLLGIMLMGIFGIVCGVASLAFIVPFFLPGGFRANIPDYDIVFPLWVYPLISIVFGWTCYELLKLAYGIFKDK